ncbi:uncharacterized protein LOC144318267 isoform X2 [Canis aureus]
MITDPLDMILYRRRTIDPFTDGRKGWRLTSVTSEKEGGELEDRRKSECYGHRGQPQLYIDAVTEIQLLKSTWETARRAMDQGNVYTHLVLNSAEDVIKCLHIVPELEKCNTELLEKRRILGMERKKK